MTDPTIQIAVSCLEALVSAAQKSAGSWTDAERNAVFLAEREIISLKGYLRDEQRE